jgi:hypothetical protein
LAQKNILYYSAFTEDLFYWDNDLDNDEVRKLKIHTNSFTKWVFEDQGQDQNTLQIKLLSSPLDIFILFPCFSLPRSKANVTSEKS